MADYLLDTDVLIDHLRGKEDAASLLEQIGFRGDVAGCNVINMVELYSGMKESEKEKTEQLVNSLKIFEITPDVAKQAGHYRKLYRSKGKILATTDVLIAATAMAHHAILVTRNTKHYPMPGLEMYSFGETL